jgi:hypothetical protein
MASVKILALHRSRVIFALDEHEELDVERREAYRDVDPITAVVRNDHLLFFEPEVVQPVTKAAKHVGDEGFELLAVNARPMICVCMQNIKEIGL